MFLSSQHITDSSTAKNSCYETCSLRISRKRDKDEGVALFVVASHAQRQIEFSRWVS